MKKYSISSIIFIYLLISLATVALRGCSGSGSFTGDEPHYLVIASGIAKYGSLEQTLPYKDEFRTRKIAWKYGLSPADAEPSPHNTHAVHTPNGLFNVHSIGLPLLLVLPFMFGSLYSGFGSVVLSKLFMILYSTLVIPVVWLVTGFFSANQRKRYWTTFALCIGLPLIPASSQIYPDVLAGLISLLGLYWFCTTQRKCHKLMETMLAAVLVFLPWLHIKFAVTSVILVLAISAKIFTESKNWQRVFRLLLFSFVSYGILVAYNVYAFGKASGSHHSCDLEISKTSFMVLSGLCFDQNHGFLFQNPVNFIGLFALYALFRYNRMLALLWGLVFLSLILPNAMHVNWYGGLSFSGRFGWSAAIVFIVPVVFGLLRLAYKNENLFYTVIILSALLQFYFFYIYAILGKSLYNKGSLVLLDAYSIYYGPLHSWLPMLYNSSWAYSYTPNYVWFALAVAIIVLGFLNTRKEKKDQALRALHLF